jgi:hypothetical protein
MKATAGSTLKFIGIAGVGLFGDGYLNISIGLSQYATLFLKLC